MDSRISVGSIMKGDPRSRSTPEVEPEVVEELMIALC